MTLHPSGTVMLSAAAALLITLSAGCAGSSREQAPVVTTTPADTLTDYEDPQIDESTLIKDTVPAEIGGIPPRRFRTKAQALEFMQESGHWDEYQQGIIPRMLDDNFAYADRLLNSRHDYFIVADKQSMHVVLFDKYGRQVKSYPMACARNFGTKHKRSDCRTPEGFFYAQGVYDSTDWLYTDDNGYTSPTRGVYGPRFIRVRADVTASIGIHGTGSPGSLGKRVSHGCMRVSNESIMDLIKYVHIGTPIIVNPSDRDIAVNTSEGYYIDQIYTGVAPNVAARDISGELPDGYPGKPEARPDTLPEVKPDSTKVEEPETPAEPETPETPAEPDTLKHQ